MGCPRVTCPRPFGVWLQVHQQPAWIFKRLFHAHKERNRPFAIHDPVIIAKRQIHHGSDHDLTANSHGSVLNLVHAQNARLRWVQDGRRHQRTIDAAVGDCECAALHFGHRQLAIAGAGTFFGDGLLDGGEGHRVGVTDDWHDEARGRASGDAHMDKVFVDDIGAVDFGVDLWHFVQRVAAGLGKKGHESPV